MSDRNDIPTSIGPVALGMLSRWVTVWEPGARQWLVRRRRIGPVIRELEHNVDPLFRQAGMLLP